MTPLDDLFSTDESRAEAQLEKVVTLNPADISDFPNHPFKVKQDEAMAEMVDSVKQYGVLVPALVRPKADGGYEMVAGHRRKCAATLAGITEMPCIVRNLTDDEATIIMVDSNLQRETILPSEKAFAYKMKLEAMKRQGQRSDLTSTPLVSKSRSNEELGQKNGDSREQVRRFIRLTELIPSVLDMVDSGKIAFRPAVELSYLSKEQQQSLYDTMECEDCTPSLAQAIKMKEFSRDGKLTEEVILSIMQEEKPNQREQFKMPKERISKYFAPGRPHRKLKIPSSRHWNCTAGGSASGIWNDSHYQGAAIPIFNVCTAVSACSPSPHLTPSKLPVLPEKKILERRQLCSFLQRSVQ